MIQGEIGIQLTFDTAGTDLTTASSIILLLEDPNGVKSTKTMTSATTNPYYTTASGDFSIAGTWRAQVKANFASGNLWFSQIVDLPVTPNIS